MPSPVRYRRPRQGALPLAGLARLLRGRNPGVEGGDNCTLLTGRGECAAARLPLFHPARAWRAGGRIDEKGYIHGAPGPRGRGRRQQRQLRPARQAPDLCEQGRSRIPGLASAGPHVRLVRAPRQQLRANRAIGRRHRSKHDLPRPVARSRHTPPGRTAAPPKRSSSAASRPPSTPPSKPSCNRPGSSPRLDDSPIPAHSLGSIVCQRPALAVKMWRRPCCETAIESCLTLGKYA